MNPQNAYAKKGIAWIVYSHERDGKEALRIMDSIIKKNQSPDYFLLKAEIAEFIGNEALKLEALDNYNRKVGHSGYGEMYNAHNIDFLIGMQVNGKALKLAQREVENRPTPESYGLLAYSYLKKGEKEKALELVENFIWDKTFEPAILTQAAEIYKENGNLDKVKELKQELTGAIYELGPLKENQILSL
jgi:tetratricopeptide (TPR) repeat protein